MIDMKKPRELVVVSGKGGTGKTSVTGALAQCFSSKVLVDCDVDAADLHLLLTLQSSEEHPFLSGHVAQIDQERCRACGLCAGLCRFDAIQPTERGYAIREHSCEGCRVCVDACPHQAIRWLEAHNGVWMESRTVQGRFFHARLDPGAENSGKLVSQVRNKALEYARDTGIPLVLLDGPPGIGCPAISTISGVAAALVVTEPTPSGLHDLERILHLCQHFHVPAFVLINKSDLSEDYCRRIAQCAQTHTAAVAGMIPYSSRFSEAQMLGQSITEAFPEAPESVILQQVADRLRMYLNLEGQDGR